MAITSKVDGLAYIGGSDILHDAGWSSPQAKRSLPAGRGDPGNFATITGGPGADVLLGDTDGSNLNDFIDGQGGNDTIQGFNGNDTIRGGAGNDSINGGLGNDNIDANIGNDTIIMSGGVDTVDAGDGADLIKFIGSGTIILSGGLGNDTLDARGATGANQLSAGPSGLSLETIFFSNFNNRWGGQPIAETLFGGGGFDVLFGAGGNDVIRGEADNDSLIGNAGDDTLDGGAGIDLVFYNGSAVSITASLTTNTGTGTDLGTDNFVSIEGLVGSTVSDRLDGGGLDDQLYGETGDDTLSGNAGKDTLVGGAGDDEINGGDGDDIMFGQAGADRLNGGAGSDTASYEGAAAAVEVSLITGSTTGEAAGDSFTKIENLNGTSFADTLRGDTAANILNGLAGNDDLFADKGDDTLNGFDGLDTLFGGGGVDDMTGGSGNDTYHVDVAGDIVREFAFGGLDTVQSTAATYTLSADVENLILLSGAEDGAGNALANDILGNGDRNRISGEDGADTLDGGANKDRLTGGQGQDVLTGGTGTDVFLFDDGDSARGRNDADRITDFSRAQRDKIDLSAIDADNGAEGDQQFTFIDTEAFSGVAGELRFERIKKVSYLEGDTDGDGFADFSIALDTVPSLEATDIIF